MGDFYNSQTGVPLVANQEVRQIALHANQLAVMASNAKAILASGGWGGGKTYVGTLWALKRISLYPDTLGLIIANSYSQLGKSTLKPLCELMDKIGIRWSYGVRPREWTASHVFPPGGWDNVLSVANGACVICQSADNFEIMAGQNIGWCWLDETADTKLECFQLAESRLRDSRGPLDVLVTTTPPLAGRSHWLYPLFFGEPEERLLNSQTFRLRTRDNPELPPDYADKLERMVGKTEAQSRLEGMWVSALSGCCFEFDRLKHVKALKLNLDLGLILSADQNVQPMGAVVVQVDRARRECRVLDEIWIENNATTRKCGEEFIRRYAAWNGDLTFFCDSTSNKRNTLGSPNDLEIMRQTLRARFPQARDASDHKIRLQFDGVVAMNAMLNPLVGEPRLFVDPKCKNLIRDLEGLRWEPGTQSIDKDSNPSLSHVSDALRYICGQYFSVMGRGVSGFDHWGDGEEG